MEQLLGHEERVTRVVLDISGYKGSWVLEFKLCQVSVFGNLYCGRHCHVVLETSIQSVSGAMKQYPVQPMLQETPLKCGYRVSEKWSPGNC